MSRFVTKVPMGNGPYPALWVVWTHNEDQTLWTGQCSVWKDGNTKICPSETGDAHVIEIAQGTPLGNISIYLDSFEYGCWGYGRFPGYGISEKDLFWASVWAVQSIERKHAAFGKDCKCGFNTETKEG